MSVKMEYKQQVDTFCNTYNRVTAEQLLRRVAEETTTNETTPDENKTLIDFSEKKKQKTAWKKVLSAACIVMICSLAVATTALAATGKLGELFRSLFGDETTADLVEEGYVYEINQTASEGIFRVDLVAVAGDVNYPKLIFDVYVEDAELAGYNDSIHLYAYTLGEKQYEYELDAYGMAEGYGVKDAETENLYHVSLDGASAWISHGEPVVVSVREIRFEHVAQPYYVNLEYRFSLPQGGLHPVTQNYYEGIRFPSDEGECYLNYVEFSVYDTGCSFMFPYDGASLEGQYATQTGLETLLQIQWDKFAKDLTLVVDGESYGIDTEKKGLVYCDITGEAGVPGWYHAWVYFPPVDDVSAQEIYLKHGDTGIRLK